MLSRFLILNSSRSLAAVSLNNHGPALHSRLLSQGPSRLLGVASDMCEKPANPYVEQACEERKKNDSTITSATTQAVGEALHKAGETVKNVADKATSWAKEKIMPAQDQFEKEVYHGTAGSNIINKDVTTNHPERDVLFSTPLNKPLTIEDAATAVRKDHEAKGGTFTEKDLPKYSDVQGADKDPIQSDSMRGRSSGSTFTGGDHKQNFSDSLKSPLTDREQVSKPEAVKGSGKSFSPSSNKEDFSDRTPTLF